MEEIRAIAYAYYANLPEESKRNAVALFNHFDSDRDGTISFREFLAPLATAGDPQWFALYEKLFWELDESGDGTLDFEEFLSFFYMVLSGRGVRMCDGCSGFIKGVYFTCLKCIPNHPHTFDLCLSCYRRKNFTHNHNDFRDNYALLGDIVKSYNNEESSVGSQRKPTSAELNTSTMSGNRSKSVKLGKAVDVFVNAYNVGNVVAQVAGAAGCTIM